MKAGYGPGSPDIIPHRLDTNGPDGDGDQDDAISTYSTPPYTAYQGPEYGVGGSAISGNFYVNGGVNGAPYGSQYQQLPSS